MTAKAGSEYFGVSEYLGTLRRRWLTIVIVTVIGTALTAGYYVASAKSYSASVLIQVNPLPTDANVVGGRTSGPVNMDNEAQVVQSAQVGQILKTELRSPLSVQQLVGDISVSVPPNTTFLKITCTFPTARGAENCANTMGHAYLLNRRLSTLKVIATGVDGLQTTSNNLQTGIQALRVKLRGRLRGGSTERQAIKLRMQADSSRLSAIQSHIAAAIPVVASLSAANGTLVGSVVTPAVLPTAPASPRKLLVLPSGLALGLIVGLALAFYRDRRNPRVYSSADIDRLADVPVVISLSGTRQSPLAGLVQPWSRNGQAIAELTQAAGAALGGGNHVLAVADTVAGTDGKLVAANVAAALARTRGETILICREPDTAALFGVADGPGFIELLAGTASLAEVARQAANLPGLRVITGYRSVGTSYETRHDRLTDVMASLRDQSRFVVLEVQSVGDEASEFGIAEFADAAIVTARVGTSKVADVADCLRRLHLVRTSPFGVVLMPRAGRAGRSAATLASVARQREPMATGPAVGTATAAPPTDPARATLSAGPLTTATAVQPSPSGRSSRRLASGGMALPTPRVPGSEPDATADQVSGS
ncbi:MAG: Wzz/FepE/Etk N-terminal domain-containing protein [Actinomycetota bacterium]|nr:Wzz/FepE/Etk N-terminal domain-containing protein [Actinomycetota bacterium]